MCVCGGDHAWREHKRDVSVPPLAHGICLSYVAVPAVPFPPRVGEGGRVWVWRELCLHGAWRLARRDRTGGPRVDAPDPESVTPPRGAVGRGESDVARPSRAGESQSDVRVAPEPGRGPGRTRKIRNHKVTDIVTPSRQPLRIRYEPPPTAIGIAIAHSPSHWRGQHMIIIH